MEKLYCTTSSYVFEGKLYIIDTSYDGTATLCYALPAGQVGLQHFKNKLEARKALVDMCGGQQPQFRDFEKFYMAA